MTSLIEAISDLTREQALEAAGFLGEQFAAESNSETPDAQDALAAVEPLTAQPFRNIEELEQLARLALTSAALTPGYEDAVREAIQGAGAKQFILGGPEIVALATLALGALQTIVSKGKVHEEETITFTQDDDGRPVVEIRRQVKYGISRKLVEVLKAYFESLGIGSLSLPSTTPQPPAKADDELAPKDASTVPAAETRVELTGSLRKSKFRLWPWGR